MPPGRSRRNLTKGIWGCLLLMIAFAANVGARSFTFNGTTLDLQEVTTQVDVYFTSMRLNRAVNQWNVDVSISNKVGQAISGPIVLLVDSFTGTTGPLGADGTSSNAAYFDFSSQLLQGALPSGGKSGLRTIALGFTQGGSPKLVTRIFAAAPLGSRALGFTRSLNEAGQPLPSVAIQETGPDGGTTNVTEGELGVVTIGNTPGNYVWKFSLDGYLPAWRIATLQSNSVLVIPYPRLTPRSPLAFAASPLAGGAATNGGVQVLLAGGAVSQSAVVQLTLLDGQSLPLLLPQGWSPLQAFWLESNPEPVLPLSASLAPWGTIKASETAALVKFDSGTLTWRVVQLIAGNDTNALNVQIIGTGAYALVVPDAAPIAPPAAVVGAALSPSTALAPNPFNLVAVGQVTPGTSPASTVPELVTATADVAVTNLQGNLPSGTLLRGQFSEHYLLQDGTTRVPPVFDNFVVGYQRPGTRSDTVHARFPMRPVLLFPGQLLNEGVVHADLGVPGAFIGGLLDTNGGLVASGNIRLLAGPGAISGQHLIQLQSLDPTNFFDLAGNNVTVVGAFQVGLSGIVPGQDLLLQITGTPTNGTFVLARVIENKGLFGLEPRERMHSDASGNLVSDEPPSGDRLPGLTVAGQYVLLQVQPQQGLVVGIAKNSNGQPAGGLPVTITGQPWLTFSAADGSFKILAPSGGGTVSVSDLTTGDTGTQIITVPGNLAEVNTTVASVVTGLRVSSLTPADAATNVPVVTSVIINFNRPINPATILGNAIQLIGGTNQPIPASVSLNLANSTVTLLPSASLDEGGHYTVSISTNVADMIGRTLGGQNQFTFSTVPVSVRDLAAQLIIYAPGSTNLTTNILADIPGYVPGSNNIVVVHGTSGASDPGVPVIIANEGSGETTTVLAKLDGSFTSYVVGQEQDFISATFINLNGTRTYLPVTRQIFDDGSVGLYPQGGVLQSSGDGGAVVITVPANAIPNKTIFKLASITTAELTNQLGGVMPTNSTVAGAALNLHIEGSVPTQPLHVRFPVDLAALGYPTSEAPTNAAVVLSLVQSNQDATTFQIMDQMLFTPQTNSSQLQAHGLIHPNGSGDADSIAAGFLDTSVGFVVPLLGAPGLLAQVGFNQVLVPILFGPRPVVIKGKVASIPYNLAVALDDAGVFNQAVSLQTGIEQVDIPFQLAQQMQFANLPPGINAAQQIVGFTYQNFQQQEQLISKPLSGAFVTVSLNGGPLVNQPGHLYPGMVYATSGSDGYFLTVAPAAGASYIVTCTHPLFSEVKAVPVNPISLVPGQQGQLGLAGAVYEQFFFQVPTESETQPTVNIANLPVQPGAGDSVQLIVNASGTSTGPNIGVTVLSAGPTNLLTGIVETNVQYSLTNIVKTVLGANGKWTGTFTVNKPVLVRFKVVIQGATSGQSATLPYQIAFGAPTPVAPSGNIPKPDTNDVHGPLVAETLPTENGFVGDDGQITINFNKPIDANVTNRLTGITLSTSGSSSATIPAPILRLSSGQQSLTVQYPGLTPNTTYQLTLTSQSIQDLAGQPFDQKPSTPTSDSFTMTFRTPPAQTAALPGLLNGKGSVISGDRLYTLDQAPQDNYLDVYDISVPLKPKLLSQTHLFGLPRDLTVIPQFHYKRNIHDTVQSNDLVVVVGGDLDSTINTNQGTDVTVPGQYLWVVAAGDGTSPQVIASPIVSYRVGSAVNKVRWAPPYVAYQEYGADIQLVGLVDLQELIIGYGSTLDARNAFPDPGHRNSTNSGVDLNGDGDYVDDGESLPLPDRNPPEFYGKHQSYVLQNTTQKILDFAVTTGARTVGVTLTAGITLDDSGKPKGIPLPNLYRTFVSGGLPLNFSSPTDSRLPLTGAYPRFVNIFDVLPITLNGVRTTITAALISLEPDADGTQKLAVVDISLPQTPVLLNKIPIPDTLLGGPIEAVSLNPNGILEVAGAQNVVQLNPAALGITNAPAGQLNPAIIGLIPNAGSGTRSLGVTDFGVHSVADGARGLVVQSAPQINFASFPTFGGLVDPTLLHGMTDDAIGKVLEKIQLTVNLAPARVRDQPTVFLKSDLEPAPTPALHYYVLVNAPGSAGRMIEIGMESLNSSGQALANLGQGFAPVRALSAATQAAIGQTPRPCGAAIHPLTAYRMSDDLNSVYYNRYLSKPFALITETVSGDDLFRLTTEGVAREILFSGAELRAFIEPDQASNPDTSPVIGPFAAQIDPRSKIIYPVTSATAFTVNRDYIVGDNPPPSGGGSPMEDTYGTIQAHSGELRTSDIDLSLPSPRMSLSIVRSIGNQDTYEGPFGVGWDFNYNQRLTILDPLTFPAGLQMALVVRDSADNSELAGSQDVLFNDGGGQVFHFRWVDTNMPPEYVNDPLVSDFDYKDMVSDYYLPEHGVFDLLVKFKDGRFERLTSDGVRYRYTSEGRLESIIDRYPKNRHDLQYSHGLLTRIDDNSVSSPRYIEIGYYRQQSTDPDFTAGLDVDSSNPYLARKICRLRDYTGRDVLFNYDDHGFLTNRLDIPVNGDNGGFSGRANTFYTYNNCRLVGVAGKQSGTPIISAVAVMNSTGKSVTQSTTGSQGNNQISIPPENSAKTVGSESTAVTTADGSKVTRQFDNRGNVTTTTILGNDGITAAMVTSNSVDGLLIYKRHPEGNSETMTYDTGNPIFRSRGNLIQSIIDPGPRGGQGYTQTFKYDSRYNLQTGDQVDPDGNKLHYTLTPDSRGVATIDFGGVGTKTAVFNDSGQMTDSMDQNGVETKFDFDASTGFIKSQSIGSLTYTFGYDGSVAAQLGRQTSMSPPTGTPTTYLYDNRMELLQVARGTLVQKSAYDELGRPFLAQQFLGDGRQLTMTRGYDDKGFITNSTTDGVEVDGSVQRYSSSFKPDDRSRVIQITHPNGTVQTMKYDGRGNMVRMQLGEYIEDYGFDFNNNLISLKQGGDLVRTIQYDGLDRAINTTRKTGTQDYTDAKTFYPGGELLSQVTTDPVFGVVQNTTYDEIDALGRHKTVSLHGNVISPTYTYTYGSLSSGVSGPRMSSTTTWDTSGNPSGFTDPNKTVVIHRDPNGNTKQLDEQEQGATYSQFMTYDNVDNQKTFSDLLGPKYSYERRGDGTLTKVTDARGNSTVLQHTALGEPLSKVRSDGMEVDYRYDTQRQMLYEGDPGAGFHFGFDDTFRMTNSSLRNGNGTSYGQFDVRSMPQSVAMPGGGTETEQFDLQRRLTQRKVSYQGTSVEEDYVYDALDRARTVSYSADGGPVNTENFDYDPAGPLVSVRHQEDGFAYGVTNAFYADGMLLSEAYPSGNVVKEVRDVTGRLTGLTDTNGNIVTASSWQGNAQPKVVQIGNTMQVVHQYDSRGRLTTSRFTRLSDGAVLAHMRYQYDAANSVQIRQFVHRGGKGDVFAFDTSERVSQAQVGMLITNAAGFGPTLYQRTYNYHLSGLDYLVSAPALGYLSNSPPFATNWPAHDDFLMPTTVDGAPRQADPMGNMAAAQLWVRSSGSSKPQPVSAALVHDGLGRLVKISRSDNVTIQNEYEPNGLRISKKVFQGSTLVSYSAYVYDSAQRLIEEYDRTGAAPFLIARYYYASGDSPVAADLPGTSPGPLHRYYFLRDAGESVIAVADESGNVVERTWYDTFGQPQIEPKDTKPPVISSVRADAGGGLLIALSESVQSPWTDPGAGSGIVAFPSDVSAALTVFDTATSNTVTGTLSLQPSLAGFKPNSVLRFTPDNATTNSLKLTLAGGSLADDWNNVNVQQIVTVTNSQSQGVILYQSTTNDTSAAVVARSTTGSTMLYQGQYFDYDSGLVYLKARYYDPYSGMFFEPDPLAYEDSVNHYAAMANNPVSCTDPSGLHAAGYTPERFYRYLQERHGYSDNEIGLISRVHEHLARLGLGDLEIAAHVRVMYREFRKNNVRWEIGIRSFGDADKVAQRIARVDEFFQGKDEKVYDKSDDRAVATYEKTGEHYTSDVDGLYAKRNGVIASIDELRKFQSAVNNEAFAIQGGWREITESHGQSTVETVGGLQKVYQHGFSLNIPQEYGSKHALSPGGTFGYWAIEAINTKMKKGIGGAFAFSFEDEGIRVQDKVNVDDMLVEHENYYKNTLLNPRMWGKGFSPKLYFQRALQYAKDLRAPAKLYPLPFYTKNEGVN